VRCELIPAAEVDDRLEAEWRLLSGNAVEPNPWFEPNIIRAIVAIQRDIVLLVVRGESGLGACMAFVPASHRWYGLNLPMWLTPHPMGTPLLDASCGEAAIQCAFGFLAKSAGARFLHLKGLAADGPVARMVIGALGGWKVKTTRAEAAWPFVRRLPEPTYLEQSLSGKHRYNTDRLHRRLEQHLGAELQLAERSDDPATIEKFIQLEARGWKGTCGTALACDPARADYFRAVCRTFASEGRLRAYCLEAGTTTVAMKLMIKAGNGLFDLRIAYDERFARFSPGVLLEIDVLREFHESELDWALSNTNHPTNPVMRIWPERRATLDVLAEAGGVGRHALAAVLGTRSGRP
jgi:CelD/BcsL family acetyltransferase involved in cellulose biosynthesis